MGGDRRAVAHDPVVFGYGVLDDDLNVGPAFTRRCQGLLDMLASRPHIARSDLMIGRVVAHAPVEVLVVESRLGLQIVVLVPRRCFPPGWIAHGLSLRL